MTKKELDEIEARANAATEGPWEQSGSSNEIETSYMVEGYRDPIACLLSMKNVPFIAHARQDVPALIAEVRRLQGLPTMEGNDVARLAFLDCLENAGVDCWEGYEQAQEEFDSND